MTRVLKQLAKRLAAVVAPRWYNKKYCSVDGLWSDYFDEAEANIEKEWDEIIWPIIRDFDFDTVLELAPGAGRNTEKLARHARVIYAVDLNEYALEKCRKRFEDHSGRCEFHFLRNTGDRLEMIADGSISAVYSWDSAVHFEKGVIRRYVKEFARVLKPNGQGFVHHSNLGPSASPDIMLNPGRRSNMSKELFGSYCRESGLEVVAQIDVPWAETMDCGSVFRKARPDP